MLDSVLLNRSIGFTFLYWLILIIRIVLILHILMRIAKNTLWFSCKSSLQKWSLIYRERVTIIFAYCLKESSLLNQIFISQPETSCLSCFFFVFLHHTLIYDLLLLFTLMHNFVLLWNLLIWILIEKGYKIVIVTFLVHWFQHSIWIFIH